MRAPSSIASPAVETVADVVELTADRAPDRIAIRDLGGRELSYADLHEGGTRLANGLLGTGLEPGDRVATWMEDRLEYVEMYVAAARAGIVLVPINARFVPPEANQQIADSGATTIVYSDEFADRVAGLESISEMRSLVHLGESTDAGALSFSDLTRGQSVQPVHPKDPHDLYIIGYTSGTTGTPKGAMLTHRTVRNGSRMNAISHRMPLAGVCAYTGSLSLAAPVCGIIVPHLLLGGTTVLLGDWDPERLVHVIERQQATHVFLPSPVIPDFTSLVRERQGALRSVASVLHSGSLASKGVLDRLLEVVGDRFVEGWGMTETAGTAITATTQGDALGRTDAQDVRATAGRAVADAAVRVVDERGVPVPQDGETIGEATLRSAALMAGYWDRPRDTEEAFRDGWYHTGDLGYMDPAGYLYITDRRDDLIVSGGLNVYPSEVEAVILELDGVRDCAIVGVPHGRWGQTPVAAVVLRPNTELDAEDIIQHCRRQLASYKKPTRVEFLERLPRTASNKVRRHVLRERLGHGDGGRG